MQQINNTFQNVQALDAAVKSDRFFVKEHGQVKVNGTIYKIEWDNDYQSFELDRQENSFKQNVRDLGVIRAFFAAIGSLCQSRASKQDQQVHKALNVALEYMNGLEKQEEEDHKRLADGMKQAEERNKLKEEEQRIRQDQQKQALPQKQQLKEKPQQQMQLMQQKLMYPSFSDNKLLEKEKFLVVEQKKVDTKDIEAKLSAEIDAVGARFPKATQPCFLISDYIQQRLSGNCTGPGTYKPDNTLRVVSEAGTQVDFGMCFAGPKEAKAQQTIGKVNVFRYNTLGADTMSAKFDAFAADILASAEEIETFIKTTYPQGCIIKTGGGAGHFAYYNSELGKVYSGGQKAVAEKVSDISLLDYMKVKVRTHAKTEDVFSFADYSVSTMMKTGFEQYKAQGICNTFEEYIALLG